MRITSTTTAALVLGLALVHVVPAGAATGGRPRPSHPPLQTAARARYLMGTRLSITLPAPASETTFEAVFTEVARLEQVMSNWNRASELSGLNRSASEAPFHCSPDLYSAIQAALHWSEETDGAFDPTVEPLVRALGLRGRDGRIPSFTDESEGRPDGDDGEAIGDGRPAPIGWRHVRLDDATRTVAFDERGVGIDLGGIGKGIALDAAARVVAKEGVPAALLDFGGQVLAIGDPPGGGAWPVGITDPGRREEAVVWIAARDRSVSTSGNAERSVVGAKETIGHILDPSLRRPAVFRGSVTLVARSATAADALSTALFVMGPERGCRWAGDRGIAALYLWRRPDGGLGRAATPAFEALPALHKEVDDAKSAEAGQ